MGDQPVRDRSLRRRSASRLYCVCTEALMNNFVHVGELVSGWLGADPGQPLTSRRRHQLPRTACSHQKSVLPVLDLRPTSSADLVLRPRDLRLLGVVRTLRQKFPNTLCRRFLRRLRVGRCASVINN